MGKTHRIRRAVRRFRQVEEKQPKPPRPTFLQEVYFLVERYEDHGTDVANVVGVYASEPGARAALAEEDAKHKWFDDDEDDESSLRLDWCACHGQDWIVEGPYAVNA